MSMNARPLAPDICEDYIAVHCAGETHIDLDFMARSCFLWANENVWHNCSRKAVECGSLLMCAKSVDNGTNLRSVRISSLEGAVLERGEWFSLTVPVQRLLAGSALYSNEPPVWEENELKLIPYFMWANRGKGDMQVWWSKCTGSIDSKANFNTTVVRYGRKGIYLQAAHKMWGKLVGLIWHTRTLVAFIGNGVKHFGFKATGVPLVTVTVGGKMSIGHKFVMNNGLAGNWIGSSEPCMFVVGKGCGLTIGDNVGMSQSALVAYADIVKVELALATCTHRKVCRAALLLRTL